MNKLALVFQIATGAVAMVPGLAALNKSLGTPPGREHIYGALCLSAGALTFMLIAISRDRIRRMRERRIRRNSVIAFASALVCALAYWVILGSCVHDYEHDVAPGQPAVSERLFFPIIPTGELKGMIAIGIDQALSDYGVGPVERALKAQVIPVLFTEVCLVLLLVMAQLALVTSLCIPAWRLSEGLAESPV